MRNKRAAWCCGRIEFRHLQSAEQENASRTMTPPLHSTYPILSAFHHQRHQLDQNILQRYMFGTTLNIGTRLLVAHSSCVSKGDWDGDVWKRLSAIFRAGSVTRCNNGWHRPVGTAEYNPAKGSTCQLGWGMWLRASPPANNKTSYINIKN